MTKVVVAVDVGGTKIAGALVDNRGNILSESKKATCAQDGGSAVLSVMHSVIEDLLAKASSTGVQPVAIGIGSAGEIDHNLGIVISATDNIPGWTGTDLKGSCEQRFNLPTFADNDANAAAIGELVFGSGKGIRNFACLTLGTGVGGGVVVEGQLLRGARNCAAALGHMTIEWNGRPCNCGSYGCLEAYVSGPSIARIAQEELKTAISSEDLFEAAASGKEEAIRVVNQIGTYLGVGLANIATMLNTELIIVGGGVSEVGEILLAPARRVLEKRTLAGIRDAVRVVKSTLGNRSGIMGAAALAWHQVS